MSLQNVEFYSDGAQGVARGSAARISGGWSSQFLFFKRAIDLFFALAAIPILVTLCVVLLILNPLRNPGPLFFRQERMGQGGLPFRVWKFRTMACSSGTVRGHNEGLEEERITPLGSVLRKSRLDEVPNFINVLIGDMSVIGPRPDMVEHAAMFAGTIPRYRDRFRVKPGITGLAQVRLGYVENVDGVPRKARNDQIYIEQTNIGMELMIVLRTIKVMLTGFGAR